METNGRGSSAGGFGTAGRSIGATSVPAGGVTSVCPFPFRPLRNLPDGQSSAIVPVARPVIARLSRFTNCPMSGEVQVGVVGIERLRGPTGRAERRDGVAEARAAAKHLGVRVCDGETIGRPDQRPVQLVERQVVDDRACAVELAGELAAVLEETENARELSFPAEPPGLVGEEDLAHALEVDRRVDVVGLLGPVREKSTKPLTCDTAPSVVRSMCRSSTRGPSSVNRVDMAAAIGLNCWI